MESKKKRNEKQKTTGKVGGKIFCYSVIERERKEKSRREKGRKLHEKENEKSE